MVIKLEQHSSQRTLWTTRFRITIVLLKMQFPRPHPQPIEPQPSWERALEPACSLSPTVGSHGLLKVGNERALWLNVLAVDLKAPLCSSSGRAMLTRLARVVLTCPARAAPSNAGKRTVQVLVLGWPRSLFKFSHNNLQKTQINFWRKGNKT